MRLPCVTAAFAGALAMSTAAAAAAAAAAMRRVGVATATLAATVVVDLPDRVRAIRALPGVLPNTCCPPESVCYEADVIVRGVGGRP
jgi:hypothetical protein